MQNQNKIASCLREDKRVWRYYYNNYYRIKDGFNIVNSETERRIVSTTVAQVTTVITVEI